jgi:hypothetical protein
MKTNIIAFAGISLLVLFAFAFISICEIRLASAQVDATSSSTDATTTLSLTQASTSSTPIEEGASSTPATIPANDSASATIVTSVSSTSTRAIEPPPQGLALVHIIGTKYTDYFTDGTTTFAFPGDPAIDSHFNVPNAPIPTHEGLTWVHTTGGYLYDTPSGDLEVGDYATQPNGSYIENAPPFVSSTSTPAELPASGTNSTATDTSSTPSSVASTSAPDASTSTVPSPPDNSSSTTTSSEPIPPTL